MKTIQTIQIICVGMFTLSPLFAQEVENIDKMTVEYLSDSPIPTHGITMEGALNALGITLDKIDYIILKGNEGSGAGGLTRKVKIDQWFWDTYFQRAEPYKFWVASGNHELEIYLKGESKAKATIYINETDSCSVEGDPKKLRYMCHGLESWVVMQLKENN
ncbi:MAG: hypothetical protein AB8D78_06290 [Akkermansiaceae bacterium]